MRKGDGVRVWCRGGEREGVRVGVCGVEVCMCVLMKIEITVAYLPVVGTYHQSFEILEVSEIFSSSYFCWDSACHQIL